MDDKQRLQLQNMIKANNVEDQTELIRNLKHSQILRSEVNNMILIKSKYRGNDEKIYNESMKVAKAVLTDQGQLVSLENALYFHNTKVTPNWTFARPVVRIGGHIFYEPKT